MTDKLQRMELSNAEHIAVSQCWKNWTRPNFLIIEVSNVRKCYLFPAFLNEGKIFTFYCEEKKIFNHVTNFKRIVRVHM